MQTARNTWALNSAVECHLHTVEVIGSNPIAPTSLSMVSWTRAVLALRWHGALANYVQICSTHLIRHHVPVDVHVSLDITFQELNKPVAYTSAWLSVPLPVHRK